MEHVLGNVFIRPTRLERAGDKIDGHTHNFDHVSIVSHGAVRINARLPSGDTVTRDVSAAEQHNYVLIRAAVRHEIEALEDGATFLCVYSHRTPQGDVTEHFTGWPDAYR